MAYEAVVVFATVQNLYRIETQRSKAIEPAP